MAHSERETNVTDEQSEEDSKKRWRTIKEPDEIGSRTLQEVMAAWEKVEAENPEDKGC